MFLKKCSSCLLIQHDLYYPSFNDCEIIVILHCILQEICSFYKTLHLYLIFPMQMSHSLLNAPPYFITSYPPGPSKFCWVLVGLFQGKYFTKFDNQSFWHYRCCKSTFLFLFAGKNVLNSFNSVCVPTPRRPTFSSCNPDPPSAARYSKIADFILGLLKKLPSWWVAGPTTDSFAHYGSIFGRGAMEHRI